MIEPLTKNEKAVLKSLRIKVRDREFLTTQKIKYYQRLAEAERLFMKQKFNQ